MSYRRALLVLSAAFCAVTSIAQAQASDDPTCVAIARIALVDKHSHQTTIDQLERLFFHARSQRDFTRHDVESFATSASIPFAEALVKAKASWNDAEYSRMMSMDEQVLRTYVRNKFSSISESESANSRVADLVQSCLDRNGVMAWASFGPGQGDRRTPALELRYKAPPGLSDVPILVTLDYPSNVNCTLGSMSVQTVRMESERPRTLRCQRDDGDDAPALITLHTDKPADLLSGGTIWLPPVELPRPACLVARPDRIVLDTAKGQPLTQQIGPYCTPVTVTMAGIAETRRQGPEAPWSYLALYASPAATSGSPLCTDRRSSRDLLPNVWVGMGCERRMFLEAHEQVLPTLIVTDALADTEQIRMIMEITPTSP